MINGKTNIYGLIGNPVSHTFSPIMHNNLFENFNINSLYCAFKVDNDKVESALEGVKSLDIKGLNVTIPHKESVIKHLDYISEEARAIGAVNTIKNSEGKLYGYNTDVYGFMKSLEENSISYKEKDVALLGFGGSAKAVVYGLVSGGIKSLTIYVRNKDKACEIAKNMSILNKADYKIEDISSFEEKINFYDILVNTTPLGMGSLKDMSPVDLSKLNNSNKLSVVDLIYNPMETLLMKTAREKGLVAINGLDMLIYQGLKAFEIWTDTIPSKSLVEESIINYIKG